MAEQDAQERNQPASPKRLREAAERGQVPRSRELTTTVVLLAGAGSVVVMGGHVLNDLVSVARSSFALDRARIGDSQTAVGALQAAISMVLESLTPFLLTLVVVATLAPLALGGWTFSPKAVQFKASKLDPVKGLGRMFSVRGLMELAKALAKFVVVALAAVVLLRSLAPYIVRLADQPAAAAMHHAARLVAWGALALSASLLVVALFDVPFQLWDHARRLRMTRREVDDEQKETDGDPNVRSRIRSTQRELSQRRMMSKVPIADVILVNPTHFAIALRYEKETMRAPVIVARGADLIAHRIRQVGAAAGVPIVLSPLLARTLYYLGRLEQEIPAALYRAVAEVLAHVYRLRAAGDIVEGRPIEMTDVAVPDDLNPDR